MRNPIKYFIVRPREANTDNLPVSNIDFYIRHKLIPSMGTVKVKWDAERLYVINYCKGNVIVSSLWYLGQNNRITLFRFFQGCRKRRLKDQQHSHGSIPHS
jgi:hypothetical protein